MTELSGGPPKTDSKKSSLSGSIGASCSESDDEEKFLYDALFERFVALSRGVRLLGVFFVTLRLEGGVVISLSEESFVVRVTSRKSGRSSSRSESSSDESC